MQCLSLHNHLQHGRRAMFISACALQGCHRRLMLSRLTREVSPVNNTRQRVNMHPAARLSAPAVHLCPAAAARGLASASGPHCTCWLLPVGKAGCLHKVLSTHQDSFGFSLLHTQGASLQLAGRRLSMCGLRAQTQTPHRESQGCFTSCVLSVKAVLHQRSLTQGSGLSAAWTGGSCHARRCFHPRAALQEPCP